jgi:Na+/melibiose symporter-like transporter
MGEKRKSLAHAYNKLPLSQKLLYACPRGAWTGISLLLQTTVRVYYIEGLGMSPEQLAVAISLCKSLDFLIGFAVGYASDHLKSKYGRRKPFIFFGTPIWLCVMFAINNPAMLGFGAIEKQSMNGTMCTDFKEGECGALTTCVKDAIADGSFPNYYADVAEAQSSAPMSLLIYFIVLYFLFYSVGVSSTIIPYDALGMEMTDDFDERSRLFGLKAGMQFVGFMVLAISGLTFSTLYEDDVAYQILLSSFLWFILMAVSFGALLLFLKTKPILESAEAEETPLIPSIRAIFGNKPYINYLWLKVPLSIAGLVPVNMLLFYVKLVLHEENSNLALGKVMTIVVFTAVASVPLISHCMVKYGKRESLLAICTMLGGSFMLAAMLPPSLMMMYGLAIFMGIGSVGSQIIPDAMLADIIDYDELHTGQRNEGLYTVVETNLQQFIEIPSGTVPFLIFSYIGYQSNSGCQCGCGSKCVDPFTRWVCPGDIGYACSTSFNAELIIGPGGRDPPCAYQSSNISMAVTLLGVVLPGACYIMAIIPVYFTSISKPVHNRIMRQIHHR